MLLHVFIFASQPNYNMHHYNVGSDLMQLVKSRAVNGHLEALITASRVDTQLS